MEKRVNSKKILNDKKNIIILSLIVTIILLIIGFFIFYFSHQTSTKEIDGSNMSSSELLDMFKSQGYIISIKSFNGSSIYIILSNEDEGITIQKIYNSYIGNLFTYENKNVNNEMADVLYVSNNDNEQKKQQYNSFLDLLAQYNISKTQLSEMLEKYYNDNKNQVEIIDVNQLLTDY